MHILITRPEEDAEALKRPLEAMGHSVSMAPLIAIDLLPVASTLFDDVSGLIATSRNGLRALAESPAALKAAVAFPIYSVGPATTSFAKSLGFETVVEGAGTAEDLAEVISRDVNPSHGPLLHLAGKTLAFDMAVALAGHGFSVKAPGLYRSIPAFALPSAVAQDLKSGTIDAVVLMSPKTAETFARLAAPVLKLPRTRQPAYFCLSDSVAQPLSNLPESQILIAKRPNLAEILILATPNQA